MPVSHGASFVMAPSDPVNPALAGHTPSDTTAEDRGDADHIILDALDLTMAQRQRLEHLLEERKQSARDAEELGKENRLDSVETGEICRRVEVELDSEIARTLGAGKARIVHAMIELEPQLRDIKSFADELGTGWDTLSATQLLQLAQIFQDAYASTPGRRPVDRAAGLDPSTGLADADRHVLTEANGILSREQVEALRMNLARAHRS